MSDLFGAAGLRVPLCDQIAAVQREIGMRRTVYPRRVQSGQMRQVAAEAGASAEPAGAPHAK